YLTYLSSLHQLGAATGGAAASLTDTQRQWATDMWNGRILVLRPGAGQQEAAIITGNTATQLNVTQAWVNPPAPGDGYVIVSGSIPQGGGLVDGNAAVVLLSTDDGQSFQFLKFLDTGAPPIFVDYPAVATGPGRTPTERSVWFTWRGGNNQIMVAGA